MSIRITRKSLASCCLAALLACGAVQSRSLLAADEPAMAKDGMKDGMMSKDDMMKSEMMKMKDGMKDDAMKMQMTKDLAQMMVMQHMSMEMCKDGKCSMMVKGDPDMMKMVEDAKAMAMNPDSMKMMHDQIMNDPEMMKKVMMASMAADSMMMDKGMDKSHDGKMGDGKMK